MEQQVALLKDQLAYINHFPPLWKYISLFPSLQDETEASKRIREQTYEKVMALVKNKRDSKMAELLHDEQVLGDDLGAKPSEVQIDAFFTTEEPERAPDVEKRAVMRDGRIPMMQKNLAKLQQKQIEK